VEVAYHRLQPNQREANRKQ